MVYGFAKQSNGAFRIDSSLGRGAAAELWIPRAPEGDHNRPSEINADESLGEAAKTPPLNILLVDDHPEVRTTTAAMLEALGHIVFEAANGKEALAALQNGAS